MCVCILIYRFLSGIISDIGSVFSHLISKCGLNNGLKSVSRASDWLII